MHWDPQGGGTEIPSPVDNALEQLWKQHVQELGITPTRIHRPPRKRRYWWVSQNRTGQQEVAGGYMWSPKTAAEGNRFFSYEFMKECAPGDIVFSFIDTAISTIGIITGFCYESDKPDEFQAAGRAWITEGWRVPVNFRPTAQAMRPADNMETLGPLLPTKYSPIQTTRAWQSSLSIPGTREPCTSNFYHWWEKRLRVYPLLCQRLTKLILPMSLVKTVNNTNFNGSIRTRVLQKQSALRLGKVGMASNYSGRESASVNPAAVLRASAMMNTGLLVTLSLGAIQITKSVSTAITAYC